MRRIEKRPEPATMAETRAAVTTDLSTTRKAREAFDQIDKAEAREHLAGEQGFLCAFCMLPVGLPDARNKKFVDERGEPTMKIAHRTPIDVEPAQALTWKNLLGSCDGGQRSGGLKKTCDYAQGSTKLTVDPTEAGSCARLRYEPRKHREGLFITSDDPELKKDVEETLALNAGDLPALRAKAWQAFRDSQRKHAPKQYGMPALRDFYAVWIKQLGAKLPPMLGVIEAKLREA